jgi:hypothetical protein
LLSAGVGSAAADAYRDLRRAQHAARLNEAPTQVGLEVMAVQRDAVLGLWREVFEADSCSLEGKANSLPPPLEGGGGENHEHAPTH